MPDQTQILLQTKLHRPRLPKDLVHRSRLIELLNQDIDRPLALIVEVVNNHVLNDPLVKKVVGMGYRAYAITQKDMIFQPMRSGE